MKFLNNIQGIVVLIICCGYLALAWWCCTNWSDKSGEIVVGFTTFAALTTRDFFSWLREQSARNHELNCKSADNNKPPTP